MSKLGTLAPRIGTLDSRRAKPMPKVAAPFYLSPEWRALITALIAHRGRSCERCGRERNDDGDPVRIFGDHIVELKDGGDPLDQRNIMLLCGSCHTRKTASERARRRVY